MNSNKIAMTVLLSVEFSRTELRSETPLCNIIYVMRKMTPFGFIDATLAIPTRVFLTQGAAVTDGQAFATLSRQINKEENDRILEAGITIQFGEAATVAA